MRYTPRRYGDHHGRSLFPPESRTVIVDHDVKFMGSLHSGGGPPPYGARIGKRRNRYVRQSLSDLSPLNGKPGPSSSSSTSTNVHVRTVSLLIPRTPPPLFLPSSTAPSFSGDLREPPDPKVIMQYRDDLVGSFPSYFSRFCRPTNSRANSHHYL